MLLELAPDERQSRLSFAICLLCIYAVQCAQPVGGAAPMSRQLLRRDLAEEKSVEVINSNKPKVIYALFTSESMKYRRKLEASMDTWGQSLISEGRFLAIGGRSYPSKYLQPGTVMSVDCDDAATGLSCKEATLMVEGVKRGADWLFITGEDNYLDTQTIERFLQKQDPNRAVGFGCLGCGIGHLPKGMNCIGVNESGGMCGGCGYAISRTALAGLTRQGAEVLIQEYGGHEKQNVANDMQTSCSLRNRGAALELLEIPTEPNPIFGITDYEGALQAQNTVGVYHYIEPDVMRWIHAFKQQLPEEQMSVLEAKAFDRGCARGMASPLWKTKYDDCLERHRSRKLP